MEDRSGAPRCLRGGLGLRDSRSEELTHERRWQRSLRLEMERRLGPYDLASTLARGAEGTSVARLVDVIARAAQWARAEQAADALLFEAQASR